MERKIIFGPPGTGKTTQMMRLMERALESGYEPEEIAFVSFTKAAVNEAVSRAKSKFSVQERQLPLFRTLHSLAYSSVGAQRDAVITSWLDFGNEYGFTFSTKAQDDLPDATQTKADDIYVRAKGLCDATEQPIEAVVQNYGLDLSINRYETFIERLTEWKQAKGKIEFSDMLSAFVKRDQPTQARVALIDEAQDLTPIQWKVVEVAFRNAEKMFIAGDDDQAIYHWAGADVNPLLTMPAERHVLKQSFRVPDAVHNAAQQIADRISLRQPKAWAAAEHEGELVRNAMMMNLPMADDEESWMLLARTTMTLGIFTHHLESLGMPYRYNGTECFAPTLIAAYEAVERLRSGEQLPSNEVRRALMYTDKLPGIRFNGARVSAKDFPETVFGRDDWMFSKVSAPRLRFLRRCHQLGTLRNKVRVDVSTIHQSKGAEADNVYLSPDLTTATAGALASPGHSDSEHRVMYVGATRARRRLYFGRPGAEFAYPLP